MSKENLKKLNKHSFKDNHRHLLSTKSLSRFNFKLTLRKLKRNKTRIENRKEDDTEENEEENEEELKTMKRILRHSSAYDLCRQALKYTPSERTSDLNKMISLYLKNLKNFMNILSDAEEDELKKILLDISSHLNYEKYDKNNIICRYGEKADKFYIILKGKVIFLVPKKNKRYL